MSSWGNKIIRKPNPNSQVIPESKFKKNIGENIRSMLSVLNKPVSIEEKKAMELKYGFDLIYYKKFNDDVSMLDDNQIYNHFIHSCIPNNMLHTEYDYIVNDNFEIDKSSIKDAIKIYGHLYLRNIKSYSELIEYRKQFKTHHIYNNDTLHKYYYDLDLKFYRNKYLNNDTSISDFDVYLHYHKNKQNLRNNKQLIVVYSPPYDIKIGGILVMHNLCKIINDTFGDTYKAKLFMHNNIRYKNPFCNDFAMIDEINDKTIVIYPEIIYGNPLNAKNVIRWILLNLGIEMPLTHYKNWNITDYVYYWEPLYYKQLCCPFINPIFKNNHLEKTKTCFLIKKGRIVHKTINYIQDSDSIQIDNLSLKEISNIFNQSKFFYCYDPYSLYALYAAMCGCVTIIHPIENITEDKYFKGLMYNYKDTIHNKGIVYGYNEAKIEEALSTINECEAFYTDLINSYKTTSQEFINDVPNILARTNLDNTVNKRFIDR